MEVSAAAMPPKAQQLPQGFWSFTGVTRPSLRRSYLAGRFPWRETVPSWTSRPSSTAHSGTVCGPAPARAAEGIRLRHRARVMRRDRMRFVFMVWTSIPKRR